MLSKTWFVWTVIVCAVGGCGGQSGGEPAPDVGSGAESVTAALGGAGSPVAWIDAAGAVTGINGAALRTDFPDGGQVAAFSVLRVTGGGYALAKIGHDAAGACRTLALPLVVSGRELNLKNLTQAVSCANDLCPVVAQGPELDPRPDYEVVDDGSLLKGFCNPKNDLSGCYCANDGGSCSSSLTVVARSTVLF